MCMNAIDCYCYDCIRSLVVLVFLFDCQVGVGVGFVCAIIEEVSQAKRSGCELSALAWVGEGVLMHELF